MPQPGKLSLHFIIPDGKTKDMVSKDLHDAFQVCDELKLQPRWETETQCIGRKTGRQDVFVFEEFEGKLFKSLTIPLCVVVGARCLLTCVHRNISIPDIRQPVYTAAMHNVCITTTQLESEVKDEVRQLVTNMGGMYCNSLRGCVTHVVAGNVISVKCQESKTKNLKLMTVEWVRAVWEASLVRDVIAVDEEFEKYSCPLFHGVVATCTKLRTAEKKELVALIQNNGGAFTGFLDASTTNLLIVGDPTGDKFQCAQQNDISCLSIQWVRDCVSRKEIVPFEDYVVVKGKQCSTPVHDQSKFLPDFSTVSTIEGRPRVSHVDETLNSTVSSFGEPVGADITLKNLLSVQQVEEAVQQVVASNNQQAGPFLDGCKIFLSGFTALQLDRLRRVLNRAGATRYDEISEALTHVVIGRLNSADMKLVKSFLHKPHVVTVQWLVHSARLECPAPEEQFLCCGNESTPVEPPSPLSKKGVAALQHNVARSVPAFPSLEPVQAAASTSPQAAEPESEPEPHPAEDLMHQYLHSQPGDETVENAPVGKAEQNDSPADEVTKIILEQDSSSHVEEFTESTYFDGLVFEILGYKDEPESEEMIMETVVTAGGRMAQSGITADYAITPCVVDNSFLCHSKHAVNYLWLEECSDQQRVLTEPLDYFYRTVKMNLDSCPLQGCILTPSSYAGRERTFLIHLMQALGARVQHVFSRIAVPEKDLLPATHLVTQDTSSPKYRAAVKWRLPAVSHLWLLACVAEDHHVDETPFFVNPDASKSSSGEEASMVDRTGVKLTPRKVPQTSVPKMQADVPTSSNAHEGASKVLATAGAIDTELNHSDVLSTDRGKQQSSGSEKVGVRAEDEVPARISTPVGRAGDLAARRSCTPQQSPAPSTPMGPPAFMTPAGGHRRLGLLFSQETPLRYEGAEPSTPSTPSDPNYISTPETPYGQFLVTDPSPNTKKRWKRWLESVPDIPKCASPAKKRRESTPMSELKRRIWDGLLPNRQADEGDCTDPPTTEESRDSCVSAAEEHLVRRAVNMCAGELPQSEASESGRPLLEHDSPRVSEVTHRLSQPTTQGSANNSEQTPNMKTGPGVHTQIVRLNEALSARKQQDSGEVKKRRCADTDRSNDSVDNSVTSEHNREYKALMGLEVPTEIAVTWEYRQYSEQSEAQTQSQDVEVNVLRVFSLSCVEAQRAHLERLIKSLGGQVSQSNMYDPSSTHLVCERLARSERMLGTIAAGKWVLHPSYITDSSEAGHFLPEEGYEWGSRTCRVGQELVPDSLPHTLACAAHRWRGKVARDGCAAFSDLKVLVLVGKERQDQFKRCVLAGNGKVVLLSEWSSANVCIVDVNKVSLDKPISLASFVRNNIPCVPTLFLYEFLMRDPPPSPAEFAIPEYKELCRQRKQSSSSSSN